MMAKLMMNVINWNYRFSEHLEMGCGVKVHFK